MAILTGGDGAVLTGRDGAVLTGGDGAVLTWSRFDCTPIKVEEVIVIRVASFINFDNW